MPVNAYPVGHALAKGAYDFSFSVHLGNGLNDLSTPFRASLPADWPTGFGGIVENVSEPPFGQEANQEAGDECIRTWTIQDYAALKEESISYESQWAGQMSMRLKETNSWTSLAAMQKLKFVQIWSSLRYVGSKLELEHPLLVQESHEVAVCQVFPVQFRLNMPSAAEVVY